jgi:hypothetical protein
MKFVPWLLVVIAASVAIMEWQKPPQEKIVYVDAPKRNEVKPPPPPPPPPPSPPPAIDPLAPGSGATDHSMDDLRTPH